MKRVIKNVIQYNNCWDIIESQYRHDYVQCKCGDFVADGGHDYLRGSMCVAARGSRICRKPSIGSRMEQTEVLMKTLDELWYGNISPFGFWLVATNDSRNCVQLMAEFRWWKKIRSIQFAKTARVQNLRWGVCFNPRNGLCLQNSRLPHRFNPCGGVSATVYAASFLFFCGASEQDKWIFSPKNPPRLYSPTQTMTFRRARNIVISTQVHRKDSCRW